MDRELFEIEDLIRLSDGGLTPEVEEKLDTLEGDRNSKIDRILQHRQNYIAEAKAKIEESERLMKLAVKAQEAADKWEKYIYYSMDKSFDTEITTAHFSLKLKKTPAKVIELPLDISKLPKHFQRTTPVRGGEVEADKKALVDAWKLDPKSIPAGVVIKGGEKLVIK